MGWTIGVLIPAGDMMGFFLLSTAYKPALGPHPVSNPVGIRTLFPGVKRPGQEADHRLRISGAPPPLPNTYSWRGA
jgi:hypothetical protein